MSLVGGLRSRPRRRRRPPDFAPSSETPGGYVGQAVLESGRAEWSGVESVDRIAGLLSRRD